MSYLNRSARPTGYVHRTESPANRLAAVQSESRRSVRTIELLPDENGMTASSPQFSPVIPRLAKTHLLGAERSTRPLAMICDALREGARTRAPPAPSVLSTTSQERDEQRRTVLILVFLGVLA